MSDPKSPGGFKSVSEMVARLQALGQSTRDNSSQATDGATPPASDGGAEASSREDVVASDLALPESPESPEAPVRQGEFDILQRFADLVRRQDAVTEPALVQTGRAAMRDRDARLVEAAALIAQDPPGPEEIAFIARELIQCTLPHSDPGPVPFWKRQNGNFTLSMVSQYDPTTEQLIGYPYGTIPRLLLFWLTTEALRTGSRRLELGRSYNDFLRALSLSPNTGGGSRGDAARVKAQSRRLFASTVSFTYTEGLSSAKTPLLPHKATLEARQNMNITDQSVLWWDPKAPTQIDLWESWIELGEKFFEAITRSPVPVDVRALHALKRSPLALDLYAWATHKAHTVAKKGKAQFVPWRALAAQFGGDYGRSRDFQKKASEALKRIQTVFRELRLEDADGGIRVLPSSRPAVQIRPAQRQLVAGEADDAGGETSE
ncbi:MAG: replication protein RepA [Vicinamibacterales bacterium]